MISFLLFVDFKKAFDLVNQDLYLGPLLFLIFINDLPHSIHGLLVKMFADDTTIYSSGNNIIDLIGSFNKNIHDFIICVNLTKWT